MRAERMKITVTVGLTNNYVSILNNDLFALINIEVTSTGLFQFHIKQTHNIIFTINNWAYVVNKQARYSDHGVVTYFGHMQLWNTIKFMARNIVQTWLIG